ncbi:MAG TPA: DUF58 domain-containing protein [Blastocatellia bacterium]|nr:DUF58 domain-containing protein [Blastocatellia bacterium]
MAQAADNTSASANSFLAPEVLARIRSLDLIARAVVEGFIAGLHRSPYLGFSTEFAEHRPYMAGDDTRYLDWKLLARTDRLYIKKYQGETNAQLNILLDCSGSMGYKGRGGYGIGVSEGSEGVTKLQYGQYLAASLAYLGTRQHDSVGLIAFDERIVEHLQPSSKLGHMRTVLGTLERVVPGAGTALSRQLHAIADLLHRRGIVVVISDLYEESEPLIDALEHLRFKGNEVIVFNILDRQELEFEFADSIILEDSETLEQMHVLPEIVRDEYLRAIKSHIKSLREGAERSRIDYELVNTSMPLDGALFSYLARRAEFG